MNGDRLRIIAVTVLIELLPVLVHAQTEEKKEMPQYLFPEFSKCNVLFDDGQIISQILNYNTISEKMVYMQDGRYYDMMNPSIVDTAFLNNCKFIPVNKMFFEVILNDPAGLFIQHKSSLISTGKPVGYGSTSQGVSSYYLSKHELSPEYINIQIPPNVSVIPTPVYWIRINGEMLSFEKEKDFISLFPDKSKEIREFIKKNHIKIEKRENLIELVKFAAGLY
jgi:hypothetical protein